MIKDLSLLAFCVLLFFVSISSLPLTEDAAVDTLNQQKGEEDPSPSHVEATKPNYGPKKEAMKECHELEVRTGARIRQLQKLVHQKALIRAEEAGESLDGFEKELLETVLKLEYEILAAELQRLNVDCGRAAVEGIKR